MTVYDINDIKQSALDYIAKLALESGDPNEIGLAATYITDFITYLKEGTEK